MSIESIRTESGIFSVKGVRLVSVVDSLFCDADSIGNLSTNVFERRRQPNMGYAFLSTGFDQIFGQIVSRRADTNLVASVSHMNICHILSMSRKMPLLKLPDSFSSCYLVYNPLYVAGKS